MYLPSSEMAGDESPMSSGPGVEIARTAGAHVHTRIFDDYASQRNAAHPAKPPPLQFVGSMPILHVRHTTTYLYKQPVVLGEHRLMFRPRDRRAFTVPTGTPSASATS